MMNHKTLSFQISNHLYKTMLAAWFVLAALVTIGLIAFYSIDQTYSNMLSQANDLESSALDLNNAMVSEMLSTRAYLISGEESAITRRQLSHKETERNLKIFEQLLASNPYLRIPSLAALIDLHGKYDAYTAQLISLRQPGKIQEATQLFDAQSNPLVLSILSTSHNMQVEIQQDLSEINNDYSTRFRLFILIIAAVFLIGSGLVAVTLLHLVAPPLNELNYFEHMLSNAAETHIYSPIEVSPSFENENAAHLYVAYNHLVQRLTESSSAILKYVSFLHHEINSLLASVVGYGSMLADPNLRPYDANSEEYGKIIVQQARRIAFLVEDFSLAAKIEGSQYHPVLMPTKLTPLLASLVREMGEESQREIILKGDSRPILLLADALSLEKALRKIIENGLKFSAPDTPLVISVDAPSNARSVQLHIQDQGLGIDASDLLRLFHPFSRIQNEATKRIQGNGMGLYLADAIIRAHHGKIVIQSQPGAGSTFTVSIPVNE